MLEQESTAAASSAMVLEARIDQFVTGLMVGGVDAATAGALQALSEAAEHEGLPACAELTRSLAKNLGTLEGGEAEKLLKEGFTTLRATLRRERSGEPEPPPVAAYASMGDDAELVADFLIEAREHLSQIEGQMLALEKDPGSLEVVHTVFRAFHTIKGLAGFLGFSVVQSVAHEVETLLDLARNEKLLVDSSIVDVVLESGDFLLSETAAIDRVLAGGAPAAPANNQELIAKIRHLAVARDEENTDPQPSAIQMEAVVVPQSIAAAPPPTAQQAPPLQPESTKTQYPIESPAATPPPAENSSGSTPISQPELRANPQPESKPVLQFVPAPADRTGPLQPLSAEEEAAWALDMDAASIPVKPSKGQPSVAINTGASTSIPQASPVAPGRPKADAPRAAEPVKAPDAGSVRVETAKLDHLMDMVGEMVIAQSLIRHSPVLLAATDTRLVGDLSQLARVTAEVQRATMSMRMVPVGQLFQKIERVIRDLSRKAGKQVVLETFGTDTEVDKTVAEELSDPLLHMVRNSVDHGIETASERLAAGKDPTAHIRLSAYHQGGQVVIEISDDGRGMNPAKIRRKAEEKELITAAEQLTEAEIFQLIFAPGFSTAEKITDVSGRGVGMDVVRRNVEKLRGRIETQSVLGLGTTFLLKLPLTLAIIDGLVVEVGSHRYIIPLTVVREIFRPLEDTLFTVESRDEMVLVREKLLPIVRLNQRLRIDARAVLPSEGLLVVIESESKLFCLLVDDLVGKQEVVIKGLGELFEDVSGVSGCAVLGNGQVGLILDMDGSIEAEDGEFHSPKHGQHDAAPRLRSHPQDGLRLLRRRS